MIVFRGTLAAYKFLSNNKYTVTEWRDTLLGFLPVVLNWLIRMSLVVFAYMYNSEIGFYHLLWVIISFLIPTRFLYNFTLLLFPVVLVEFCIVYVSNIKTF
jgi:hypothetical protein